MSAMIRALVALAILFTSYAASASVWFGDEGGLHRVDTTLNRADLNIGSSEPMALAVNSTDGSVWALTKTRISKYNAAGTSHFSISFSAVADRSGDGRRLAVNAANGSAWVATERMLAHLGPTGTLRSVIWSNVTDMAVAQDGTLWVLDSDANEVRRYADEGALLSRTGLTGVSRDARYIALDDTRGAFWLGGKRSLVKRSLSSPSTVQRTVTTSQTVSALSLDVQTAELWVLGTTAFYGYRPDGTRFLSESISDDGVTNAETLAFDIGTQAIWIGHRRGITRFERDGDRVATIRANEVETVAVSRAAVNIDPTIALVSPVPNALLTNARPAIVFQYGANCAGTPCSFPPAYFASFSINAILNGANVGALFVFDPATGQTRFTPAAALPQGVNQLSGQAVDAAGHLSPLVTAQFTVDTVAPQFVNVTPPSGSAFTAAPITIAGGTDDPGARVRLSGVAGDQPSSFGFPVTLASGLNSYTLSATDPVGNSTQVPLTYTFTPPNVPPTVSITAPANGATFVAPASVAVTAVAADPDGTVARVDFFNNGAPAGSDAASPFNTTLASLGTGTYVLIAIATDNRGGSTTSAPITVTVAPPNVAPVVVVLLPGEGATFTAPATIEVEAQAADSDGTVTRVELLQNGAVVATITSPPYKTTLTGLAAGTYAFTARAFDNAGASTTSGAHTVTVVTGPPNTPPTVKLTSPSSGSAFSAPASVTVSATAADADGIITKVEFLLDGVVAATSPAQPYQANLLNIPAGNHTIAARATDNRGGTVTSPAATITVATFALTIASPAPNASITGDHVLVTGRATTLANSGVIVNGQIAPLDAAGNFFAIASLTAGPNTITVTLTGPDGRKISRDVPVTATGTGSPFTVAADPAEGLAPLDVTFAVGNPTQADATFMFGSSGPFTVPAGSTVRLSLTYPAGVFAESIAITAAGGSVYTHRLVVNSIDPARLDQMLRAVWSGLNNALLAGDKEGALRTLNEGARFKYGPVFEALMPFMPEIVASYSTLGQSSLTSSVGEYAVSRMDGAQRRLYMIYFVQDADGVWHLDEM